jgi:quercetin dioxygenase-like cupin family protein
MRIAFKGLVAYCTLLGGLAYSTAVPAVTDLEADPSHHKLEFQNEYFQVNRGFFGPGEMAADFFDAEGVVIVALTPLKFRLHFPDGKFVEPPPQPAGAVFWAPPGKIRPENLSDQRVEFIIVIPRGSNGASKHLGADALKADPEHWKVEVENEAVRALRYRAEPRAKGVKHGHPAHVVVFLSDGKALVDRPGGETFISVRKRGDVVSAPAGEHAPENLLDEPVEVILVERK